MNERSLEDQSFIRGDLCLALITLLSSLPYLRGVGFYSDDWGLLAEFVLGRTELHEILKTYPGRPLQGLYLLLQFKLFGLHPLGYHLVSTFVLGFCAVFLHRLLARLGLDQGEAFAAAAITIVLPQLSTVRVWVAATQIPLSMLAAICSMHAQLSYMETRRIGWIAAATVAAVLSVLAYEIFAPLILALPVWLVFRGERAGALVAVVAVTLILCAVFKVDVGRLWPIERIYPFLSPPVRLFDPTFDWRTDEGLNVFGAVDVYLWQLLKGWAAAVGALVTGVFSFFGVGAAVAVGALCWWGIDSSPQGKAWRVAVFGVAIVALGHAVFLLLGGLMFSPNGLANRVSVAAAPGIALLIVAIVMAASSRLPKNGFSSCIAVIVAISTLRLFMVEARWVEASTVQKQLLASVPRDLAQVPGGSVVILTGVCPYRGPGVVMETRWDVGPALSISLGREVRGNIATDRTRLGEAALETSIYGEPQSYSYGPRLWFYQPGSGPALQVEDRRAAVRYFEQRRPPSCPLSYPGQGEQI